MCIRDRYQRRVHGKKVEEQKKMKEMLRERLKKNFEIQRKNELAINTYLDWDNKKKIINNKVFIKIQNKSNNLSLKKRASLSPLNKTTDQVELQCLQNQKANIGNNHYFQVELNSMLVSDLTKNESSQNAANSAKNNLIQLLPIQSAFMERQTDQGEGIFTTKTNRVSNDNTDSNNNNDNNIPDSNNNAPSNEENVKTNPVQATIANAKTEEIFPKYHATLKTTNQRMAVLTKKVKLFQIQQLNENERRGNNYDVKLTRYQDQKGEQFVNQDNLSNSLEKKVKSQATCHQGANVVQIRDPNNYLVQYSPKYSQKMAQIAQIYIKK
eukprot:TRINITY_DN7427_c0_g1_i1.p1 TRINITY_DN7427_c0_g1~~TRINITY_DN7427_c0_g1_i1.p1  ORF type:complete len:325 (+),score=67.33 TRINITY_DN7427_c0_g1_i1:188-1162(+)